MGRIRVLCVAVLIACASPLACSSTEVIHVNGSANAQQDLMNRWNAAADVAATAIDFHWPAYDQFPHPTFKFGTEEAYQQFAEVLLLFFQRDFDFLAQNHLFQTRLRNVFSSGQVGLDTTFQELATDFSSSTAFGNIPDATRQELKGFLDRM